jgi:G3E family GTPase
MDNIDTPNLNNFEIHRLKGILVLQDGSCKIIQAVREVFEIRDSEPKTGGDGDCKLVLIGRGLGQDAQPWRRNFETFLETGP